MKILLSAIACNPYTGSEGYFGWAAVQCLARDHDLWVITSGRHRLDLEKATAEGLVPKNISFIYAGQFKEWHQNRLIARLQSWKEYISFSKNILPVARNLHQTVKFDLVHHVTYATWRIATPLWKLGIPFIFGPIGGNEQFPLRFFPILSSSAVGFELLRMLSNVTSRFSPSVRKCIRHASHIFVANSETEYLVKKLRGTQIGISRLMAAFYSSTKIRTFTRFAAEKNLSGPLRLFAGGNLEGRKGMALALHALARAKKVGVKFHYRLGGKGPEFNSLQNLAARLDLQDDILFGEPLSGEDYSKELGATHIFLLPSFRESAGLTMMEAMLAGCVPIVADCGGPGNIVTEDCGYKIPVSTRERMIEELANTIVNIDRNREIILKKGAAAAQRIATNFTAENYRKTVNAVYLSVTKRADE
jgi:glycosyltransferase involved in cell wall biosynthesis